jgi:hypothetical protein
MTQILPVPAGHGEVAAALAADGGTMRRRRGPCTIAFGDGPPPHLCFAKMERIG